MAGLGEEEVVVEKEADKVGEEEEEEMDIEGDGKRGRRIRVVKNWVSVRG